MLHRRDWMVAIGSVEATRAERDSSHISEALAAVSLALPESVVTTGDGASGRPTMTREPHTSQTESQNSPPSPPASPSPYSPASATPQSARVRAPMVRMILDVRSVLALRAQRLWSG
jgi:hypothetical protein